MKLLAIFGALLLPMLANAQCVCEQWHVNPPSSVACDCEWYTVKPNGTLTTRPAYTLQAGGLIKSKVRAPVGAPCDLTRPSKPSGKDIYASWGYDTVALCSKSK